ncbi:MAG TPA: phosphatase PAP2 family protein [Polyangiaceae bacterium]|nr:phosphatase PAP2 family protein [Polyangiaceae bacterium]
MTLRSWTWLLALSRLASVGVARAQETTPEAQPAAEAQLESDTRSETKAAPIVPPKASERKSNLEPQVAKPGAAVRPTLQSDPVADGCIIAVSLGFAGVLELVNSTGEIHPQQIDRNFDNSRLISIDRAAVTQTADPSAGPRSNVGLGVAGAFAVIDPVLSGVREQSVQAGLVDAIMYSETVALTLALTNVVKMAVRRPRPLAYTALAAHRDDPNYSSTSTDSSLSFFSGHASMTSAIGATATYLAFTRSSGRLRPWLTLSFFTGLTTFVSVERVRAGKHFPTDVIAGAIAGAGIGVVVPHLHRSEDVQQRRVWVGFEPAMDRGTTEGGVLSLNGLF